MMINASQVTTRSSHAMTRQEKRNRAVNAAIEDICAIMESGASVENLGQAKARLIALAACQDLFTFEDFPLPEDDAMENSYLLHEYDDGSYSLYVNSGAPHQYYAPHDHGDAWAVIAGVQGRERHQLYVRRSEDDPGDGPLIWKGEFVVAQGEAVTMQPDGIHEVNAMDGQPLLHLHLYAKNFVLQGDRWKYDLEKGVAEPFLLDELGSVFDAR